MFFVEMQEYRLPIDRPLTFTYKILVQEHGQISTGQSKQSVVEYRKLHIKSTICTSTDSH